MGGWFFIAVKVYVTTSTHAFNEFGLHAQPSYTACWINWITLEKGNSLLVLTEAQMRAAAIAAKCFPRVRVNFSSNTLIFF